MSFINLTLPVYQKGQSPPSKLEPLSGPEMLTSCIRRTEVEGELAQLSGHWAEKARREVLAVFEAINVLSTLKPNGGRLANMILGFPLSDLPKMPTPAHAVKYVAPVEEVSLSTKL